MSGFEQVLVSMVSNIVAKRLFADEKIRNHIFKFDIKSKTYAMQRSSLKDLKAWVYKIFADRKTALNPPLPRGDDHQPSFGDAIRTEPA